MKRLEAYLQTLGCGDKLAAFETYFDMLVDWNTRFNLTAVTERDGVETVHFLDSLAGLDAMGETVLDVGTGAGFPALPLAIVSPARRFTLVDSLQKRVNFLNAVVEALGLRNVTTVHARAEDLPKTVLYDTVTARAVAPLAVLAEYCLPFVRVGGHMVAYKARDVEAEVADAAYAIRTLGGGTPEIRRVVVPDTDLARALVVIEKVKPTPAAYPRKGNKPRTSPLLLSRKK